MGVLIPLKLSFNANKNGKTVHWNADNEITVSSLLKTSFNANKNGKIGHLHAVIKGRVSILLKWSFNPVKNEGFPSDWRWDFNSIVKMQILK